MIIDNLQYANWSEKIFREMREGDVDAVHVTIAYHENFRETVLNFEAWNRWFERYPDLIMKGLWAEDIDRAQETGRTAIFFGFQNPSPIEDDIGLVEIVHSLGARFMQLSYNNQSLLATGCYESEDPGITRMGRQVIKEMNRVGLVVDMSHSADRSTIEAAEISERPIAITHANTYDWQPALRNKRHDVIKAVTEAGGMLGFSLYPHHLKGRSDCTLQSFCEMDYGEGSASNPGFPPMPSWFQGNKDFSNIAQGLRDIGFSQDDVDALMGGNWYRFYKENFVPRS
jgi:membrane dipeptidase